MRITGPAARRGREPNRRTELAGSRGRLAGL